LGKFAGRFPAFFSNREKHRVGKENKAVLERLVSVFKLIAELAQSLQK
jgi:hypothetical protein